MMIGVLHERGIHLHLAFQHGLEFGVHLVPAGNGLWTWGEHRIGGNDPLLLLLLEGCLALLVQPCPNLPLYFSIHSLGT